MEDLNYTWGNASTDSFTLGKVTNEIYNFKSQNVLGIVFV